jgi:hypothetical protein
MLFRDTLPSGIWLDGGSDWVILDRQLAQYAIYSQDEIVNDIKQFYANTLLPAESFFHVVCILLVYVTSPSAVGLQFKVLSTCC